MPIVMASKLAEMRRGGVGKKEFNLDPDPLGTHSKKERTKSKKEIITATGSAVIFHRPVKNMEFQYTCRVTTRMI